MSISIYLVRYEDVIVENKGNATRTTYNRRGEAWTVYTYTHRSDESLRTLFDEEAVAAILRQIPLVMSRYR